MRYSSVDKVSFKVFRSDADNAAPYRVKGCDVCRYIPINIPFNGKATFRIVPGEKAYRKNGYWLDMFFKGGDFAGGTVYMVRNFLPIGAYPILIQGNDVHEKIGNAWQDFRDLAAPGNEYMFKDIKKDELLDRAQLEWVDFLNKRDSAVAALAKMSVDYWEDPHLSPEVGMCISKFQNACDRYEKKRWGKVEFEDPCPIGEWGRFK